MRWNAIQWDTNTQIHRDTNTQIHKYTDIQIQYKYVNQCDGKLEEAAAPMHIVEIIKRIETWLFSFLKQM